MGMGTFILGMGSLFLKIHNDGNPTTDLAIQIIFTPILFVVFGEGLQIFFKFPFLIGDNSLLRNFLLFLGVLIVLSGMIFIWGMIQVLNKVRLTVWKY